MGSVETAGITEALWSFIMVEAGPHFHTWLWHKPQHTSAYQGSFIMLVDIPSAGASHTSKPKVNVEG